MELAFNIVLGVLILLALIVLIKGLFRRTPDTSSTKEKSRKDQAKEFLGGFLGNFLAEALWPICVIILFIIEVIRRTGKKPKRK